MRRRKGSLLGGRKTYGGVDPRAQTVERHGRTLRGAHSRVVRKDVGQKKSVRRRLGVTGRRGRLRGSGDRRRNLLRVTFSGVVCRGLLERAAANLRDALA